MKWEAHIQRGSRKLETRAGTQFLKEARYLARNEGWYSTLKSGWYTLDFEHFENGTFGGI